jgi:hypothetical protein
MASRKTQINLTDRSTLIELLRPLAAQAGERCNLTELSGAALRALDEQISETDDADLLDWYERVKYGALADRIGGELSLLLKAKHLDVTLPFMRHPIPMNPRQGVRVKGMKEYQQTLFLAFTWDEYEAWRKEWLTRFERAGGIRAIIGLIDRVRLLHPDVANIAEALALGGATVEAVTEAQGVA